MESQPQNPEFRNIPENFHPCKWLACHLIWIFPVYTFTAHSQRWGVLGPPYFLFLLVTVYYGSVIYLTVNGNSSKIVIIFSKHNWKLFFLFCNQTHVVGTQKICLDFLSIIWAMTCAFQQCGILTSVDLDESVQPPFKLRNSKWCLASSLSHRIFKQLAKALTRLRVCAGWSEPLLVAPTTLVEI